MAVEASESNVVKRITIVVALNSAFEPGYESRARFGFGAIEEYIGWLPSVDRVDVAPKLRRLTRQLLRVPIRLCVWRTQAQDIRRNLMFNKPDTKPAGVTLLPLMVPGLKNQLDATHPNISKATCKVLVLKPLDDNYVVESNEYSSVVVPNKLDVLLLLKQSIC